MVTLDQIARPGFVDGIGIAIDERNGYAFDLVLE